MEYLRLLDIDPTGSLLRLINVSHQKSLDLKNISIRQVNTDGKVANSYTFHPRVRSLLRHNEVVTIYKKNYRHMKFDNEPYMFIANDIARWLIDDHIRTELSFNDVIFHSQERCVSIINDIPLFFTQYSFDSQSDKTKTNTPSVHYGDFHFPYCLSTDNSVNPHTHGVERQVQHTGNFNDYHRRLTTSPKKIQINTNPIGLGMDHPIFQNEDRLTRLRALEGFEIVMILDDSSSMRTPIIDRDQEDVSPFSQLPTRWDELKHVTSIVVDLAATLDPDGIDIFFLNRPPLLHVNHSSALNETFSKPPNGPTPLTQVLRDVLTLKRAHILDRKLLLLIATDGLPTNDRGQSDLMALEKLLRHERDPFVDRIYIAFIACTNDLQSVGYLNRFDKTIPNIDVLDDYHSERAEILAVQGKTFPFSYGDYVVKILMGSIDPWFDQLDEKKVKLNRSSQHGRLPRQNATERKKSCIVS
ncbi:unnamed protein product [Adineta ricciae]|uniref:VWFA domain-containing protein n=1 Tax=Adineta ricciae TaxID=249248 RepID=A0A813S705_ADIRI|nr:unnamed protein product [Adineta ricciae]CAF0891107.1 unnamed protein product [Adineta ricciae]